MASNKPTGNRWDISRWTPGKVTILQAVGIPWNVQFPSVKANLAQQAAQVAPTPSSTPSGPGSGTPGSNPTGGNISTGGASPQSIKGVFNALRSAGASVNAAIGIIANGINESHLDPEARAMDTNGKFSNGVWQFNEASYPSSGSLVTGHPAEDLVRQVRFLAQVGGLRAASGSTPQQAASNFAANFERCAGCQPGGAQNSSRVGNVAGVMKALGL